MGVKQLRNSSTINNINSSTKQILVSAWTVETHTHTNTHTSHKIKGDRQPKRAKQHREEERSRGRWKPASVLKAVQNYFLKKYQSAVIFSCAPRVYITTNIERMKLQLREGAQRGRTRSNRGWEGLKANAELRSIFGRGGWGVGDLSAACLEITNWTWLTFNKLIRWLWNAATL